MKFWGFIIAAALIIGGGQSLYTCIKNSEQAEYTFENYKNEKPDHSWLKLTDCSLDLTEATYFTSRFGKDKADEIYVPIKSSSNPDTIQDFAMVLIKDKKTIKAFNEILSNGEDIAKLIELMEEHGDLIYQDNRTIEGLVKFGFELDSDEVSELRSLNDQLSNDFIILEEGGKPSWSSVILLPIGLGILYFMIFGGRKKEEEEPVVVND